MNWLTRGLTIIGGVIAIVLGWPIMQAAWQAQRADAVLYAFRTGTWVDRKAPAAGVEALSQAIALDPAASRYLLRSELLAAAALTPTSSTMPAIDLDADQRTDWMRRARADLVTGLANAPAHGIDWLRLASLQQQLDGPSRRVVALMFTSQQMSAGIPETWPVRLRLILDCWPLLSSPEKNRLKPFVETVWHQSVLNRDLFGAVSRTAADHAILTWFVRDLPGAPQELAKIVARMNKT